jgi:hypothetical protein
MVFLPFFLPQPAEDNPQIIFDMPGPERERVPPPEPTHADLRT